MSGSPAQWKEDRQGTRRGLLLEGNWSLPHLDAVLGRTGAVLFGQPWDYLSLLRVEQVDSATLAFLLEWQEQQRKRGMDGDILDMPQSLQELVDLYGLGGLWAAANSNA